LEKIQNAPAGAPTALIASKQMIDFHMNNYIQSIQARRSGTKKAKLKKEF